VTESVFREPVFDSVQLFYLGAFDFFLHRGSFNFWDLFTKLDQQCIQLVRFDFFDRRYLDSFIASETVIDDHVTRSRTDSTGRRPESDLPVGPKPKGLSRQLDMVFALCPCRDDQISVIQDLIVSDSRLRDAIVPPRCDRVSGTFIAKLLEIMIVINCFIIVFIDTLSILSVNGIIFWGGHPNLVGPLECGLSSRAFRVN